MTSGRDIGTHKKITSTRKKISSREERREARYHTSGEIAFSPAKQTRSPLCGDVISSQVNCRQVATLQSCRRSCGHPDPLHINQLDQHFIEDSTVKLYAKLTKKPLFCK